MSWSDYMASEGFKLYFFDEALKEFPDDEERNRVIAAIDRCGTPEEAESVIAKAKGIEI